MINSSKVSSSIRWRFCKWARIRIKYDKQRLIVIKRKIKSNFFSVLPLQGSLTYLNFLEGRVVTELTFPSLRLLLESSVDPR